MIGYIEEITKQMTDFPPYETSVVAAAKRFIRYGKMFPFLYVIQEDDTLLRQVPSMFIRDFIVDPTALGWVEELRGSPPILVIKVLRSSDIFERPIKDDELG